MVSVPLQGTYLPYAVTRQEQVKKWGLIFLTIYHNKYRNIKSRFRPLAGDLSSLHQCGNDPSRKSKSFRPLAGDLSSLLRKKRLNWHMKLFPSPCRGLIFLTKLQNYFLKTLDKFPSPCRGLIFLTLISDCNHFIPYVSVPLQGTYLPYKCAKDVIQALKVSVPLQGTYLPYDHLAADCHSPVSAFPSPCRGLIFLTR